MARLTYDQALGLPGDPEQHLLAVLVSGKNPDGTDWAMPSGPGGTGLASVTSTALEASRVVKASAGVLYGLTGYNSAGVKQYIQLHDAATVPADGAVPKVIIPAGPAAAFFLDYDGLGRAFAAGIVICNSSTAAAKTIGAADCFFDVQAA